MRIAREDQGAPQELPKTPRRSVSPPPYAKPLDSRIDSISRITLNRTPLGQAGRNAGTNVEIRNACGIAPGKRLSRDGSFLPSRLRRSRIAATPRGLRT